MARQARTTESLKRRISRSLFELMQNEPYQDISVSEICDHADVGRATYYRHFSSKRDVILYELHEIFEERPDNLPHSRPENHERELPTEELRIIFTAFLTILEKHKETLRILYQQQLDYLLFKAVYRESVKDPTLSPALDSQLSKAIHAASAFAIIDQWILNDFHVSPSELADLLLTLFSSTHGKVNDFHAQHTQGEDQEK